MSSRRHTPSSRDVPDITGRQRLIDAAMRLHSDKRSLNSLGIREIAREAHLNPNTFYRHFESIDDLAVAAIAQCGDRIRPLLHHIRSLGTRVDPASITALEVSAYFAFVLANADWFVVYVTEYHGGSARVREAIDALLREVASEMCDDVVVRVSATPDAKARFELASRQIVVHVFHLAQEYIEHPERREAIIEASECMIAWMFAGAARPGGVAAPALVTT